MTLLAKPVIIKVIIIIIIIIIIIMRERSEYTVVTSLIFVYIIYK